MQRFKQLLTYISTQTLINSRHIGVWRDTFCRGGGGGGVSVPVIFYTTGPISKIQTLFDSPVGMHVNFPNNVWNLTVIDYVTGQIKGEIFDYSGFMKLAIKISMLTHELLGRGGGIFLPPLYVCRDISVTRRANRLKLRIPSNTSILHLLWFCFEIRRKTFERWPILWRHYTQLLVENWLNFASLWKTHFLMKMQMESTWRRKMINSTRWLSRFFEVLGFWPLRLKQSIFFLKMDSKMPSFQNFQKAVRHVMQVLAVYQCTQLSSR